MRTWMRAGAMLWVLSMAPMATAGVVINELRIDQPGTDDDEYLELAGPAGQALDGLTYLVIGDGAGGSGVIEAVVDLSGRQISASGFFVVAEGTFTLGAADLIANLNFENSDNVTHLLVSGFSGSNGDDLDLDDDGVLDVTPWVAVLDAVALVEEENPPAATEFFYLLDERVGPDAGAVPGHAIRCPDPTGAFMVADFDPQAGTDTPGFENACAPEMAPIRLSIPEIQGAGHASPVAGQMVITRGVVTAVDSNAFFLQDPDGDGDVATSDAIFVFTGSAPNVSVGDRIEIAASVTEFVPGGPATRNLSITELVAPIVVTPLGTVSLPDPVRLGADGRMPPTEVIDDDAFGLFDPSADGIDFFESLEAMRVTVSSARAVAGTNRFGEIYCVVDAGESATGLSARGTLNISPRDFNPERIQLEIDSGILGASLPRVDTGALFGDVTGVVSYSFGNFEVLLTEMPATPLLTARAASPPEASPREASAPGASALEAEVTSLQSDGRQIRIASFNVLNLDPNDADGDLDVADGRFAALGRIVAHNLRAPEIVALQEVQDDDGSVISDVTVANQTLATLAAAIRDAGGPVYTAIDNPFIGNGTSGGQPGGNIRVAYLYDSSRVELIDGSVATLTDPADQRTNPQNPFFGARLPLVARFRVGRGAAAPTLTLVAVHLSSKGGSAPLFGQLQPSTQLQEDPAVNGSLDERRLQSLAVADFVAGELATHPDAHLAVLGDFNEFEFISPLSFLGENLMNLTWKLPPDERYSFIFEGNSQSLDHILVSPSLGPDAVYDVVHTNSEFAETPKRASDHDPVIARLRLDRDRGSARSYWRRWKAWRTRRDLTSRSAQ